MTNDVLAAAHRYLQSGLSIIPIKTDGGKGPSLQEWKPLQSRLPSEKEIQDWFGHRKRGIAIVTGAVSGLVEVLDFDDGALFSPWCEQIDAFCPGLIEHLVVVMTPTGGYHVYVRSPKVEGNLKLARRTVEAPEGSLGARLVAGKWVRIETLIETRGEGGYALAPPSPRACHPLNFPYKLLAGDLADIPFVGPDQRQAMLSAARSFNQYGEPEQVLKLSEPKTPREHRRIRPGDDYNERGDWNSLLAPRGWRRLGNRGEMGLWQPPGKSGPGISATTNFAGSNLLYVFSTSACPFEPDRAYDLFAGFALLEHAGDYRAAAKALAVDGYGQHEIRLVVERPFIPAVQRPTLAVNLPAPLRPTNTVKLTPLQRPALVARLTGQETR